MYELEISHNPLSIDGATESAVLAFESLNQNKFTHVSLISWGEHCTECAAPACFKSCELYERRSDGLCRRFAHGIVPVVGRKSPIGSIVRIDFKPWGKLMAYGNTHMVPIERASRVEKFFFRLGCAASKFPSNSWPRRKGRSGLFSPAVYILKKKLTNSTIFSENNIPDAFCLESYNANSESVNLVIEIRKADRSKIPFIQSAVIRPGVNDIRIPFNEIIGIEAGINDIELEIIPEFKNSNSNLITLFFRFIGFASFEQHASGRINKSKYIKALVWDLDNTIWIGTLTENDHEKIVLRDGVRDVLVELDRRGIVNSIASKNNHVDAWQHLVELGIADYFVFPAINWNPKSQSIHEIVNNLNVGSDTIAFIDDQAFEREQVQSCHPAVRVYRETQTNEILSLPEFNPPTSNESSDRRAFYKSQGVRLAHQEKFQDDYYAFLKSCNITLNIHRADLSHLDRIHELSQRTNQLNFSGNRYSHEKIVELLDDEKKDLFVLECNDNFGTYGTIGLAIIDISITRAPQIIDLMFSCRIQAKRVEHAFLNFIIAHYYALHASEVIAIWKKTPKNMPAGKVFQDLGFCEMQTMSGVTQLRFQDLAHPKQDGIIEVVFQGEQRIY